jgi:hypothetical protein
MKKQITKYTERGESYLVYGSFSRGGGRERERDTASTTEKGITKEETATTLQVRILQERKETIPLL